MPPTVLNSFFLHISEGFRECASKSSCCEHSHCSPDANQYISCWCTLILTNKSFALCNNTEGMILQLLSSKLLERGSFHSPVQMRIKGEINDEIIKPKNNHTKRKTV